MREVRIKAVVRNPVEKSDGTPQPFIALEDIEGGTGRLLVGERSLKAADDSVRHRSGDVLFSKLRPYLAKSYSPAASGTATSELLVLRPGPELDSRFLFYVTLSSPWLDWANTTSYGTKMPRTSWEALGEYRQALPALTVQRRIADFLDVETARIDRLLSLRSQQIRAITELLRVRAAQATGRVRLHAGVESDRSSRAPLRRSVHSVRTGTTPAGLKDRDSVGSHGKIPWYTPAAIDGMMSIGDAEKFVALSVAEEVPIFSAGSVLVTGIGESLGKVGFLNHDATGNQQLTALEPNQNTDGRFLAWQLWAAQEDIRSWAQYSRVRIINNDVLKSFPIYLPSKNVQVSARVELDSRLNAINRLRGVIDRFSHRMYEKRLALITAAVTGQIDVTTARGVDL